MKLYSLQCQRLLSKFPLLQIKQINDTETRSIIDVNVYVLAEEKKRIVIFGKQNSDQCSKTESRMRMANRM